MDPSILFERLQAIEKRLDALEQRTLPLQQWGQIMLQPPFTDCPVCGLKGDEAMGYVCNHPECPFRGYVHVTDGNYYGSEEYSLKERISARLHERAGLCRHCGKRECAGRQSNSYLPDRLKLDDVIYALALDAPEISKDGSA